MNVRMRERGTLPRVDCPDCIGSGEAIGMGALLNCETCQGSGWLWSDDGEIIPKKPKLDEIALDEIERLFDATSHD